MLRSQRFDLVKQIECERDARSVDLEILREMAGLAGAPQ